MNASPDTSRHALSFAGVADAYERARPTYPEEAVAWSVGGRADGAPDSARVVELGAGTGKLTRSLVGAGHRVVATDPLEPMLRHLASAVPQALPVLGNAEQIPVRGRWADVVVTAQAYHWFDRDRALGEIARVLRPGGYVALMWNERDERIPWVRRLGLLMNAGHEKPGLDPTHDLLSTSLFGFVDRATFRFWQPLDRDRIRDLVASRSHIAVMDEQQRSEVLAKVDVLYDDYGRGPDGMLLPYLTHCFRAVVRARADADDPDETGNPMVDAPGDDADALLIDFQ
jgi:SAM-dependent methyltransferase